ncbi:MAG: ABC transporter substrate-binding protein [Acidobacteriia bacterium]|nr:ABC transporter substrate-binding protein [Terriglobia bacterium]
MSKLRLTMSCWDYDRTRALREGYVAIDGVELNYLTLPIEETFFRMMRYREFEIAEMSLSSYVVSLFRENPPFIAIPVFISRAFRHSGIFIHTASGITEPRQLIGKRVGNPEYQLTAIVWIRGILSDEFGVPIDSVTYVIGGQEEPGRIEKTGIQLPPQIPTEPSPPGKTLARMLEAGEIDALYAPRAPSTLFSNPAKVRRLFPDYPVIEREYYNKTKIFPIMHVVVIRRDVYESNRWLAQSLYKALAKAKRLASEDLRETAALKVMLPWALEHVAETEALMGLDFWPYGLEDNAHALRTFLRYSWEQGLSPRQLDPGDLFAPETLESFKI